MKNKIYKAISILLIFTLIFNVNVINGISVGVKTFAMGEDKESIVDNYYIDEEEKEVSLLEEDLKKKESEEDVLEEDQKEQVEAEDKEDLDLKDELGGALLQENQNPDLLQHDKDEDDDSPKPKYEDEAEEDETPDSILDEVEEKDNIDDSLDKEDIDNNEEVENELEENISESEADIQDKQEVEPQEENSSEESVEDTEIEKDETSFEESTEETENVETEESSDIEENANVSTEETIENLQQEETSSETETSTEETTETIIEEEIATPSEVEETKEVVEVLEEAPITEATKSETSKLFNILYNINNDAVIFENNRIILQNDILINKTITVDTEEILDLNSYSIINNNQKPVFTSNSKQFIIKDSSNRAISKQGQIKSNSQTYTIMVTGGHIYLNGGSIYNENPNSKATVFVRNADLTISGSYIYGADGKNEITKVGSDGSIGLNVVWTQKNHTFDFIKGSIQGGNGGKGINGIYKGISGHGLIFNGIYQPLSSDIMESEGEIGGGNGGAACIIDASGYNFKELNLLAENFFGGRGGLKYEEEKPKDTRKKFKAPLKSTQQPSFPAKFNSVDAGYTKRAGDQQTTGLCMVFACMTAAEIFCQKFFPEKVAALGYEPGMLDFSEDAMAYANAYGFKDPLGNGARGTRTVPGKDTSNYYSLASGNSPSFMRSLLGKWYGPMDEKVAPWKDQFQENITYPPLEDLSSNDTILTLKNWISVGGREYYDDKTAHTQDEYDEIFLDEVKQAITNTGSSPYCFTVPEEYDSALYVEDKYDILKSDKENISNERWELIENYKDMYNFKAHPFITDGEGKRGGHAVTAIGWDDNFPKEYFAGEFVRTVDVADEHGWPLYVKDENGQLVKDENGEYIKVTEDVTFTVPMPERDGAFLIRNSWWKDEFQWIPYSFILKNGEFHEVVFDLKQPEDHLYYYDGALFSITERKHVSSEYDETTGLSHAVGTIYSDAVNIFKVQKDSIIDSVEYKAGSGNKIKIYEVEDNSVEALNKLFDSGNADKYLLYEQEAPGTTDRFFRIKLDKEIKVEEGKYIAVDFSTDSSYRPVYIEYDGSKWQNGKGTGAEYIDSQDKHSSYARTLTNETIYSEFKILKDITDGYDGTILTEDKKITPYNLTIKMMTKDTDTIEKRNITYYPNGGSFKEDKEKIIIETAPDRKLFYYDEYEEPIRDGYKFMGWGTTSEQTSGLYHEDSFTTEQDDIELYAIWKKVNKIHYDLNRDNYKIASLSDVEILDGFVAPYPSEVDSDDKYVFEGWFVGDDRYDFEFGIIHEDTTLVAHWRAESYPLSLHYEGSIPAESKKDKFTYDERVILPATSSNTVIGKIPIGWNTKQDGSGIYYTEIPRFTVGPLDLYMIYELLKYNVTFDIYPEELKSQIQIPDQIIEYGSYAKEPKLPELNGYEFIGWRFGNNYGNEFNFEDVTIVQDTSIRALWKKIRVNKVTFDLMGHGKSTISEVYVKEDETLQLPPMDLTDEHYTFKHWYVSNPMYEYNQFGKKITEDANLKALWEGNEYNLVLNLNGGNYYGTEMPTKYSYSDTESFSLPSSDQLGREHYTFDGWYDNAEFTGDKYTNIPPQTDGDKEFFAKWKGDDVRVYFDNDVVIAEYGKPMATPSNPTRDNYIFDYWYVRDNEKFDFNTVVTETIMIKSKWKKIFTVKFNLDETSGGTVPPQTVAEGEKAVDPNVKLKSEMNGYIIDGWKIIYSPDKFDFENTIIDSNYVMNTAYSYDNTLTLYPHFIEGYYINIYEEDALTNLIKTVECPKGTKVKDIEPIEKDGYAFVGWHRWGYNIDGEVEVGGIDFDLVPQYKKIHTISFDPKGHNIATISDLKIIDGEKITSVTIPTDLDDEEILFKYWYDIDVNTPFDFDNTEIKKDYVLKAKWTSKANTLTLIKNGGEFAEGYEVVEKWTEEEVVILPTPSEILKTGYTFKGWFENEALSGNAVTKIPEGINVDKTFYAKWEINKYNVDFEMNGVGTQVPSQTVEYNNKVTAPTNPTAQGYEFLGWFKDDALTTEFDFEAEKITEDTTIYASWHEVKTYTVSFMDGVASISDVYVVENKKVARPTTDPTKDGFVFVDWYQDSALTTKFNFDNLINSDTFIYAKWNEIFIISFNTLGGTLVATQSVVEGSKATCPATNPTKTGYTFKYWYENDENTEFDFENTIINEDILLNALWEVNEYNLQLNLNGGTYVGELPTKWKYDEELILPATSSITKTGYTPVAFNDKQDFTGNKIVKINKNTEGPESGAFNLYLEWEINKYNVVFEMNGVGTQVPSQTVEYNNKVTAPTDPTAQGYEFLGWFKDDALTTEFDFEAEKITEDTIIYASWHEVKTYTVSFMDGVASISDVYVVENKKVARPTTNPTKDGFVFADWYEDEALTTQFNFDNLINEDTFIYAKWNEIFTVSFNTFGGTVVATQSIVEGGKATKPATNPTKEGYTFKYWYETDENTEFNFVNNIITKDIILNAKWEINKYKVSFEMNGHGTQIDDEEIEYNNLATEPEEQLIEGYTFDKWFSDEDLTEEFDFANTLITEDITLYAKWDIKTYLVNFELNGHGLLIDTQEVEYQHKVEYPNDPTDPEEPNWAFIGWYVDNETFNNKFDFNNTLITDDINIYALWKQKWTVSFDLDGGSGSIEDQKVIDGEKATKPSITPTKGNDVFDKWMKDDIEFDFANTLITEDTTITATYRAKKKFQVTFIDENGAIISTSSVIEGQTVSAPSVVPRSGYTYSWKKIDGSAFKSSDPILADTIIKLVWTQNKPTIKPSSGGSSRSSGGGGGGSSSGGGSGSISTQINTITGELVQQTEQKVQEQQTSAPMQQRVEAVKPSAQNTPTIDASLSIWFTDPVTGGFKLGFVDMNGHVGLTKNGFFNYTKTSNNQMLQATYYFNENGDMQTGWIQTADNNWYFFDTDKTANEGNMCIGWKMVEGAWYFFNEDGSMMTSGTTPDGYQIGADGTWAQ